MRFLLQEDELLEIRQILQAYSQKNACISCGLCCKISGRFFIDIECRRLERKFDPNLFTMTNGTEVIQIENDLPLCLTLRHAGSFRVFSSNEMHIIDSAIETEKIDSQPWFETISCKVYEERPVFCRYYPVNSYPSYCMIGLEFSGSKANKNSRFNFLMAKYLYTYRWECLQGQSIDFSGWRPHLDHSASFRVSKPNSLIYLNHRKSKEDQSSAWNLWRFFQEIQLTKSEYFLIKSLGGSRSTQQIERDSTLPEAFETWNDWWLDLLVLETVEYPESVLQFLLKGVVRF